MSAYSDAEAAGGKPIECYHFAGTFRNYDYTSQTDDVTVNGIAFTAIAMNRSELKAGTQDEDTVDLELEMSVQEDLATDYAFSFTPPDLFLTIYRVHRNTNFATDWIVYWQGQVAGVAVNNGRCTFRVPSVFASALLGTVPSVYYQGPCNNALYDGMCKVDRATYTVATTVTSVGGRFVVPASVGGRPVGFFNAGEMVTAAGERRMIVGQSGGTLELNYEFARLAPGDSVTFFAGCNHAWGGKDTVGDCTNKFNNSINFGGFPLIPTDNPFEGTIDNSVGSDSDGGIFG